MKASCHAKVRYTTREFAEEIAREQRTRLGHHAVKAASHGAYYCEVHGAWHTGHASRPSARSHSTATSDAIGRLRHMRDTLVQSFGQTHNPRDWDGVRMLARVIIHLQRKERES